MKWSLFLALVSSIGLVAGNGAWKENYEYKYKLVEKTWFKLPSTSKENGIIAKVFLSIRPQSENVLLGKVTQFLVTRADEKDSEYDSNSSSSSSSSAAFNSEIEYALNDVPLNKQFQINLRNGVIISLAVDRNLWSAKQILQLKYIVSHFQVDAKAQNLIRGSGNYQVPDAKSNNAFYKTSEPTVIGVCETDYDISRLPEYLSYAKYGTIPSLPKYASGKDVIEIVKHTNYKKCNDRNEITRHLVDQAENGDLTVMPSNRIIISGSVDKYTIHSSVFTNKLAAVSHFTYLTLESMDRVKNSSDKNNSRDNNLQNIGNLVFKSGEELTADFKDRTSDYNYNQRAGNKQWNDRTRDYNTDVRLNTDSDNYNRRFANNRSFDNKVGTRVTRDSDEN